MSRIPLGKRLPAHMRVDRRAMLTKGRIKPASKTPRSIGRSCCGEQQPRSRVTRPAEVKIAPFVPLADIIFPTSPEALSL
jgi:hypothetical protein